jgi:hypothetical protein
VGKRVTRRSIRYAIVCSLAAAGLAAAFLARARTGPAAPPGYAATIGASGKPVPPTAASRKLGIASLQLIGTRGDRAFYRGTDAENHPCLGAGNASDLGTVGFTLCSRDDRPLTASEPVIVVPDVQQTEGSSRWQLVRVDGFAADSVARVTVTDSAGSVVAQAPVVNNVFSIVPAAAAEPGTVKAYDRGGRLVFSHDYSGS